MALINSLPLLRNQRPETSTMIRFWYMYRLEHTVTQTPSLFLYPVAKCWSDWTRQIPAAIESEPPTMADDFLIEV
jgi:hypothetical protein